MSASAKVAQFRTTLGSFAGSRAGLALIILSEMAVLAWGIHYLARH